MRKPITARQQAVVRRAVAGTRAWARSRSVDRALPSFLILGGQRCGTTSLYNYLAGHPDVEPPLLKEIQFFTLNFDRGPEWYRGHFPPAAAGRQSFDASPYYLFHPLAPERAAKTVPRARLIALVRNPVDRAYSHYRHNVALGVEDLSFEAALEAERARLAGEEERILNGPGYSSRAHRRFSYAARGDYETQLRRWLDRFGPDRVKVLVSEEFFSRTAEVFNEVLSFLDLEPHAPERFDPYTRSAGDAAPIQPEVRAALARRFEEPNRRLEALLGRDLPWA